MTRGVRWKACVGIGLVSLVLATPAAASHDKTDIVKVQDGGVYVGEIKGVKYANLTFKRSRRLLILNLGAVYNRENVTDDADANDGAETLVGVTFRRFKRGSHSPNVLLRLNTFTDVSGTSRFRAVFVFNIDWKIVGDLKFSLQVRDSYDSNPPAVDANKNDLTVVNSVGYTF